MPTHSTSPTRLIVTLTLLLGAVCLWTGYQFAPTNSPLLIFALGVGQWLLLGLLVLCAWFQWLRVLLLPVACLTVFVGGILLASTLPDLPLLDRLQILGINLVGLGLLAWLSPLRVQILNPVAGSVFIGVILLGLMQSIFGFGPVSGMALVGFLALEILLYNLLCHLHDSPAVDQPLTLATSALLLHLGLLIFLG